MEKITGNYLVSPLPGLTTPEAINDLNEILEEAIKAEHIVDLRGIIQALKDKETTVEELFGISENRGNVNSEVITQSEPVIQEEPTVFKIPE